MLSQKEKGLILENTARMEQDLGKAMSQRGLDEQTGAKHWWWELELPVGNTHMRMQSDVLNQVTSGTPSCLLLL